MAALLALLALSAACHPTSAERTTMRRWLLCEECTQGERDAVVALGDNVTGALADALKGPPASGLANIRSQAEVMYARLVSPPVSQADYVQYFVANYVATYQSRSAVALGLIDTPRAHAALLDALQGGTVYRHDVLAAIGDAARISLGVVSGNPQSAPPDSFVRIPPTVGVKDSATGQPLANVLVIFRIDSGGGRVTDSIRHTDANGLATTSWQLGPGVDVVNLLRAVAAGRAVTFRATARDLTPRVAFVVQPSTGRVGLPITPAVRVALLDAWGDPVTAFSGSATLTVIGTPVSIVGSMAAGQVDFPGLVLTAPATGLRLLVIVAGGTPVTSDPFDVTP